MDQYKEDLLRSYLKTGFNEYQAFWDIVSSYPIKDQENLKILHQEMERNKEYQTFKFLVTRLINESTK